MFYLNWLEKFIPLKLSENSVILRKNSRPEEIYLILSGNILNTTSKHVFSTGSIIGETDIIYGKRERLEEFITLNKAFVLKLSAMNL